MAIQEALPSAEAPGYTIHNFQCTECAEKNPFGKRFSQLWVMDQATSLHFHLVSPLGTQSHQDPVGGRSKGKGKGKDSETE